MCVSHLISAVVLVVALMASSVQAQEHPALQGRTLYLRIPVTGTIGIQTTSEYVSNMLLMAKAQRIMHVVFEIDTDGGYVDSAQQIQEVMNEHGRGLTYHAVVKKAVSAGIWITFACDHIYVMNDAVIGGALVYQLSKTGNVAVDAKMNSVLAATLAATAERQGFSADVIRAMILAESELYVARDGQKVIFSSAPQREGDRPLVRRGEVLTLTAAQAVDFGIAKHINSPDNLGKMLALPGWTSANDFGPVCQQYVMNISVSGYAQQLLANETDRLNATTLSQTLRRMTDDLTSAYAADPRQAVYIRQADGTYLFIDEGRVLTNAEVRRKAAIVGREFDEFDQRHRTFTIVARRIDRSKSKNALSVETFQVVLAPSVHNLRLGLVEFMSSTGLHAAH